MIVLIPMAGAGSRFRKTHGTMPKPLIDVNGLTLIEHSIKSFNIDAKFIFITRKFDDPAHNQQLTELLKNLRPESIEIQVDQLTLGACQTCLAARDHLDNDEPLFIYNCDQLINWNPMDFLNFIEHHDNDGAVVLYRNTDPKNSFAEITDGKISRLVEKKAISDHALIGFHYWKHGKDFVQSADRLVENFHISGKPECYVSETYNYLIEDGKFIIPYHIAENQFIPLGTPEDVARYLGKIKEFYTQKPKTIFCDLDGTVFKHCHVASDVLSTEPQLLNGVLEKFNQWDSQGHRIILVTARKESTRVITEQHLRQLGIVWDQLIMSVGGGGRYLINDKLLDSDVDRATAINVVTDRGFNDIDWKAYDL